MEALSFKLVGHADWVKLIAVFSQEKISPSLIREGSFLFSSGLVWKSKLKRELVSLVVLFFFR